MKKTAVKKPKSKKLATKKPTSTKKAVKKPTPKKPAAKKQTRKHLTPMDLVLKIVAEEMLKWEKAAAKKKKTRK
jgi:hypothetical protein